MSPEESEALERSRRDSDRSTRNVEIVTGWLEKGGGSFTCPSCLAKAERKNFFPYCPSGCTSDLMVTRAEETRAALAVAGVQRSAPPRSFTKLDEVEVSFEESGWSPFRLTSATPAPAPSVGEYAPGRHLFTRGVISIVFGAGESGKTSLMYLFAAQEVRKGNAVLLIDYEMNASLALDRLHGVGMTDAEIDAGIIFLNPQVSFSPKYLDRLRQHVTALGRPLTLAVVDSLAESAGMDTLNENDTGDMTKWFRTNARWLVDTWPTCAAVIIDHLPKGQEEAKSPIGSQRKRSGCHMLLSVRNVEPMSRDLAGHSVLTVQRDRGGYLPRGGVVARLDGGPEGFSIESPSESDAQDAARALLRDRIFDFLLTKEEKQSVRAIRTEVGSRAEAVGAELAAMESDGLLISEHGPRNSTLYGIAEGYMVIDRE